MKLTIKLDPTVGQLMRSLKRKINNLIFNWFKKPYLNYQQRRFEKSKILLFTFFTFQNFRYLSARRQNKSVWPRQACLKNPVKWRVNTFGVIAKVA